MVKVCTDRFQKHFLGQKNISPGYYMEKRLHQELGVGKKALRDDWDLFIGIDGPEGSGIIACENNFI